MVVEQVFANRFTRELARYRLACLPAIANGVKVANSTEWENFSPEKRYKAVMYAQNELDKSNAATDFGIAKRQFAEIRQSLDIIDFEFTTHLELLVPPEVRKNTSQWQRWVKNPNPEIQKMREDIAGDFYNFWHLYNAFENGKLSTLKVDVSFLLEKVKNDVNNARKYLKANSSKIEVDNPFE